MHYIMTNHELQQNQASISALATATRLLHGLNFDEHEPDPRLQGIHTEIADAIKLLDGIDRRIRGAVNADLGDFEQRKAELEPILKRCSAKVFDNEKAINLAKNQLKDRLRRDETQVNRLKATGLKDEQIAKVFTPTTPQEITAVDMLCAKLKNEIDRLHRFVSDHPRYDPALIAGIEV